MKKQMIPCLYLQYEKAVTGFGREKFTWGWRCRGAWKIL